MNSLVPNKLIKPVLLLSGIILVILGCDDIFVEDISDYIFQLQAPSPGLETKDKQIRFRWEEVPDATSYKFEVATPGFESDHKLVFDTLITINDSTIANRIDTLFEVGTYEWRVKALNSISSTNFFNSSFTVLPPFNISSQKVVLQAPSDQFASSDSEIRFIWEAVEGASFYRFKIKSNSWSGDSIFGTDVFSTNYNLNLNDGIYAWGVSAIDTENKKNTDYTIRTLTIDKNPPTIPILFEPANKDTLYTQLVGFIWNKTEENAKYELEVFSDSNLKNKIFNQQLSDTSTYVNIEKTGSYFWRVNSTDQYGNSSNFSSASTFELRLPADISKNILKLLSPSDGSISIEKEVAFWWERIEGATNYNLQVVQPSFSAPVKLVYDHLLDSNSLKLKLTAGDYQWRVKAVNNAYETVFSTASFSVYNSDLTEKKVTLLSPLYEEITNKSSIKFSWENICDNASYHLIIKKGSWESGVVVQEINTNKTSFEHQFNDGTYNWGVKATDTFNGSETEYSTREFTVDLTAPEMPQLKLPSNNLATEELLIEFSWEPADATDSELTYTIEMYEVYNNAVVQMSSKTTKQKSVSYNFDKAGKYKWRVYATDKAGNISTFSEYRFFEIKEELNLSGAYLSLMSPVDNLSTNQANITFWWNELNGAEKYVFELVKPSFGNIADVIKNVEQTGNQIQVTLSPGNYQWRVKAKNDSSETGYTMRSLTITN